MNFDHRTGYSYDDNHLILNTPSSTLKQAINSSKDILMDLTIKNYSSASQIANTIYIPPKYFHKISDYDLHLGKIGSSYLGIYYSFLSNGSMYQYGEGFNITVIYYLLEDEVDFIYESGMFIFTVQPE